MLLYPTLSPNIIIFEFIACPYSQLHVAVMSSAAEGSGLINELYARAYTPTALSSEDLVLFKEQAAAPLDGPLELWMDQLFRQSFGATACKATRLNTLIAPPQLSRPVGPRLYHA